MPSVTNGSAGCYTQFSGVKVLMWELVRMDREPSRTQKRNVARREARRAKAEATRVEHIVKYLRLLGGSSAAVTAVSLMLLPEAFPYFVSCVYGTIVLFTADAFYELRQYRRSLRVLPVIVGLIILGLFSAQFVFTKLAVTDFVWSTAGAYQPGSVVNGIQWSAKFNDIHVVLSNDSNRDYTQLDALIRPTEPVVAATAVTTFPTVSLSREYPMNSFDLQMFHQATGTRTDISIKWFASTTGFRLHCDLLPSHSRIEVLMAVATINQKAVDAEGTHISGPWGFGDKGQLWWRWQTFPLTEDFFGPQPSLNTVKITGHYVAFYRHKNLAESVSVSEGVANAIAELGKRKHK
jgi:hypothetical protein